MAGLTLSNADAVLKEDYLPGVREQLNQDTALAFFEKNSEDIEGRRAVVALHVSRNSGVGARAELGALPAAGNQGYTDELIPLRYNYARIQVSGQTIKAMTSDKGSFVRAVRSEMDGAVNDLKRDVNRQAFGTADGVIAKCGVTTASATVVLDASALPVQVRQFEVNMLVDIGTVANPTAVVAAAQITGVDPVGGTITINSSVTTAATNFIFRAGAGGAIGGAGQKELTGLQAQISASGVLFGVDPSVNPIWKAYVDSNSGNLRSVSENMFAKAAQRIRIAGGTDVDVWMASDGVHRAYSTLLTGLKRFPGTTDLKGGYKGLSLDAGGVSGQYLTWDRDSPANKAFGLRTQNIQEYRYSDWEWMDQDGAILQRVIGFDAYEATLFKYHELATDKRNAHGLISDITEA